MHHQRSTARDLLIAHFALECIGVDGRGDLHRIPCADPDDIPRCYVGQIDNGYALYLRSDLAPSIRSPPAELQPDQIFADHAAVQRIIGSDQPPWIGTSYVFTPSVTPADFPDVVQLDHTRADLIRRYDSQLDVTALRVWAIITDDQIVATCQSSRENERAGEAWVRTIPSYQRRGYARQVTAAWDYDLIRQGKIAFYSHALSNAASAGVARSLAVRQYISDVAYP